MPSYPQIKSIAAFVLFSVACSASPKFIRLDKTKSFPPNRQQVALAVLNEAKGKGEDPKKLFADIRECPDGTLVFNLWSEQSYRLLKRNKPVNPGGGLEVKVDPRSCKIIETLFWQ